MKTNLIYFIYYPGYLTEYHYINLEYLQEYIKQFTGKIIITIASDPGQRRNHVELLDLIPRYLNVGTFKLCHKHNDRINWEAAHFLDALEEVNDGETFYGHCKGISRGPMPGLYTWINYLYNENLRDHQPLDGKIFSGICGKRLPCPPYVPEPFHFSGSFYWFNTNEVKKRIHEIKPEISRYLTERLPGIISTEEECRFDFYSTTKNENFYQNGTWTRINYEKQQNQNK